MHTHRAYILINMMITQCTSYQPQTSLDTPIKRMFVQRPSQSTFIYVFFTINHLRICMALICSCYSDFRRESSAYASWSLLNFWICMFTNWKIWGCSSYVNTIVCYTSHCLRYKNHLVCCCCFSSVDDCLPDMWKDCSQLFHQSCPEAVMN